MTAQTTAADPVGHRRFCPDVAVLAAAAAVVGALGLLPRPSVDAGRAGL